MKRSEEHHKNVLPLRTFPPFSFPAFREQQQQHKNCDIIFQFAYFSHQWLSPFSNFGHSPNKVSGLPFVCNLSVMALSLSTCCYANIKWNLFYAKMELRARQMTFCGHGSVVCAGRGRSISVALFEVSPLPFFFYGGEYQLSAPSLW